MTKGYTNIFVPEDLTIRIDAMKEELGLKSRTEVVRMGQTILEKWLIYAKTNQDLAFFTVIQQISMEGLQNRVGADILKE